VATLATLAVARELLGFEAARLVLDPGLPPTQPLTLSLQQGDLVLVDTMDVARAAAFADAAVGLADPAAGVVRFRGRPWSELAPDAANAMRGQIGRLVAEGGWIEHLGMLDDVLLPQLHHTNRRRELLMNDAARLSREFGLPGVPLARPAMIADSDRLRAGLVRAFLGRPRLVVLEHVAQLADADMMERLVNVVRAARDRGAAVLWLTLDSRVWRDSSLPVTRRLRIIGHDIYEGMRTP
jgi:phospholipid/cholesterol/gamma-HCH transport system ATP-binding protein